MTGHSILETTCSVVVSIHGHHVVGGWRYSQPISAVELITTRVPAMFNSRRVSNIIPFPVMCKNPCCPANDLGVCMHLNMEINHCFRRDAPV